MIVSLPHDLPEAELEILRENEEVAGSDDLLVEVHPEPAAPSEVAA